MLVLDTCTLIFDALEPQRLTAAARTALEEGEGADTLCCADISLWEIAMLVAHDRLVPGCGAAEFIDLAVQARGVRVLPITPAIATRSATLPLHGDPADRLIAATAIEQGATLITADKRLREAPDVPTLW